MSHRPSRRASPFRNAAGSVGMSGFTSIELLVTVSIVAILTSLIYPSFKAQVAKARRADALVALTAAQLAEERWRAQRTSYGSLSELGMASVSSAGHYTLQVTASSASGYQILATARGAQGQDALCRNLRVGAEGANLVYASGPDDTVANPDSVNRRCWSL